MDVLSKDLEKICKISKETKLSLEKKSDSESNSSSSEHYDRDSDTEEKNKNIELNLNFKKALLGYHIVNKNSLKEAQWEEINSQILIKSNYSILEEAKGSHKPGCDLKSCIGNFSNKTTKQDGKYYNISSYRLTTICSENNIGTISDILGEINKRDTTFEFYSILARDEIENKIFYKWYLIPKSTDLFNPKKYNWKKMIGKRGINKGKQIGWETDIFNDCKMNIRFSMSSQLWLKINISEIKKYIISEVCCVLVNNQIDYIDLYNKLLT